MECAVAGALLHDPSPESLSDVDVFALTPASSLSISRTKMQSPIEESMIRTVPEPDGMDLLENLDSYVGVGVLRKCNVEYYNTNKTRSAAAIIPEDGFPETEITYLENHNWIQTRTHVYESLPQWCHVRVYVLPDDVGRTLVPRTNRHLRRALRIVMAKIDRSASAWEGRCLANDNVVSNPVASDGAEDESLWYIFNTLQDPDPKVEDMKDPYARRAMEELLSVPAKDGIFGQDYPGVIGLKTALYSYQRRSAATMIQREAQPAQVLDPRLQVYTSPTGQEYYYDKEEGCLLREKRLYSEACGGILAETMGCGKTLICLSVILATRGHLPRIPTQYQETGNPVRERTASLVEMAAAAAGRLSLPWENHFDLLTQSGMYYERCINACERNRGKYTIPPRQSKYGRNRTSHAPHPQNVRICSGTLVVVPANLVDHWEHEIDRHTEGLKVLTLRTIADPTPPVDDLLQYDIILFSKIRFEKEAGESNEYSGSPSRDAESPLSKLHWLRIIVDEGHNAAGHGQRNNMTEILNQIQVERRWVASGTPSTGLYGVEVSLASQETVAADTDLPEATSTLLEDRKKTGKARDNELKDLDKLRLIVVEFLDLKPWSNSGGDDRARWSKYVKTVGEDGKRRKSPSLRATLQSLVVRHRLSVIHQEIPLPRLHNKVVYLEPTFYDKLSINLFLFGLAVNAVTSERKDQDYMFHPRNRKHLSLTISNLRQAGFWWVGSEMDISVTIDIALSYLADNRHRMSASDVEMLNEGIRIARKAVDSSSRKALVQLQELGVYVQNFPSNVRPMWALDSSKADAEPLLLGISQARMAQKFVTSYLWSYDPAEGLGGAGIRARRELAEKAKNSQNNVSEAGSGRRNNSNNNNTSQEKVLSQKRPGVRTPKNKTFTKGLYKSLPPESPLARTKLVGTASAKLSYLLDRVLELHEAEKIIIFYDHINAAFWIGEGLETLGIEFRIYAGTLRASLKTEYLSMFRESEEIRVLLMDLRQASHGLHLACASRVFIVNPIWQPNVESQAIKRAHRIGQTRPVFVETLVLKDTLEDKILKRRKEMSDAEIQDAERDLLDDNIMSSIIQNEPFIPMPEDEESALPAFLHNQPGLFDRHKLPIPDDGHIPRTYNKTDESSDTPNTRRAASNNYNNNNTTDISPRKTPRKRKQVAMSTDTIPQIQSDLMPDVNLAELVVTKTKRRRTAPNTEFVTENGIVMTPPMTKYPKRPPGSSGRRGKGSPGVRSVGSPSVGSPDIRSTPAPAPVFLGDIPQLYPGGSSSNASASGSAYGYGLGMNGDYGSVFGP